ncbi:MAG: hypothetical protein JJV97_03960 [SAR324 cluster bacterium]|nr:hypothetical protein [SAR324 cluster bacterium]
MERATAQVSTYQNYLDYEAQYPDLLTQVLPHKAVTAHSSQGIAYQKYCYLSLGSDAFDIKWGDNRKSSSAQLSQGMSGILGCRYLSWGVNFVTKQNLISLDFNHIDYGQSDFVSIDASGVGVDYLIYQIDHRLTFHTGIILYESNLAFSSKNSGGGAKMIENKSYKRYLGGIVGQISYFFSNQLAISLYYESILPKSTPWQNSLGLYFSFHSLINR